MRNPDTIVPIIKRLTFGTTRATLTPISKIDSYNNCKNKKQRYSDNNIGKNFELIRRCNSRIINTDSDELIYVRDEHNNSYIHERSSAYNIPKVQCINNGPIRKNNYSLRLSNKCRPVRNEGE